MSDDRYLKPFRDSSDTPDLPSNPSPPPSYLAYLPPIEGDAPAAGVPAKPAGLLRLTPQPDPLREIIHVPQPGSRPENTGSTLPPEVLASLRPKPFDFKDLLRPAAHSSSPPGGTQDLPPHIMAIVNPGKTAAPDPMAELNRLIGLREVKEEVSKTLSLIKLEKARKAAGKPLVPITRHLVFTGNPGTGKTTVARMIGRLYRENGLLKSGHLVETDRAGLVAAFEGQTAIKTKGVITDALDGVLFIDEAYSLTEQKDQYGNEAVQTLLKMMEDHRNRLVVIAAGYQGEMQRFVDSNPGLQSRFKKTIHFPDYTTEEMMKILLRECEAAGCTLSAEAMIKAAKLLVKADPHLKSGNGRAVRNVFEEMMARQAIRLDARGQYGHVALTIIEADDVPGDEDAQ